MNGNAERHTDIAAVYLHVVSVPQEQRAEVRCHAVDGLHHNHWSTHNLNTKTKILALFGRNSPTHLQPVVSTAVLCNNMHFHGFTSLMVSHLSMISSLMSVSARLMKLWLTACAVTLL